MGASTSSTTNGAQALGGVGSQVANAGAGIATGLATGGPIGAGIAAGFAAVSFIQASKQAKLQREAEQNAAKALEEAKRQINVNPFAALGIQKEPYELEREALLAQGAQAIAAGQEADRGAAATAGRIQMSQNEAQAGQRAAMQKEMSDLEKTTADEQANIKTQLANVGLLETEGYMKQAANAAEARAQAIQQGFQTGAKALQYGLEQVPLYLQGRHDRAAERQQAATLKQISQNAKTFAAGTPQGASNYVMQDQQVQNLNASNWLDPTRSTYNPYNQNPFLFYQNQ